MRCVVMVLLLVSAMMLTGTHASWWTRTRDRVENAAIGAATSAAVGAVVGKRETKARSGTGLFWPSKRDTDSHEPNE
ncbi:hypothetical protein BaRGS_00031510 [Batillaria attramentaria]|uniref:Uncharacterized protein n=1 Tax=Batillaria attramentaria TaxID=370345 RepID=A0ABD0JQX5_9CAEN